MIKEFIKRDGSIVPFNASKALGWGKWGARGFSKYIDWQEIVVQTVAQMSERCHAKEFNAGLIRNALNQDTWAGQLMAGRIYAADIHKEVFGGKKKLPLKQVHEVMVAAGVMLKLDYSDEEYALIETWIDHERDFHCAHYQLKQGRDKYALRNRITGRIYETRQHALARVAMVMCEDHDPITRMARLESIYSDLYSERLSAPTPNHNNFGTGHNGFFSCCLFTCDDTKESIAASSHVAEVMTYMSAGLGENMQVRSLGDPIRGGSIVHSGKIPYYGKQTGIVKSNKQGSRGGSLNEYFSAFDPEVAEIMVLKNPRTPINKRNRSIDYTMMLNRFLLLKSALGEQVFLFNCYSAPDLYKALYGKDLKEFVALYEKYEKDEKFKKTWVSARQLVVNARSEGFETGRFYLALIDEINYHTPHRDPILSSNLCVEITQPTASYAHLTELYSEKFLGFIKFEAYVESLDKSVEYFMDSNDPVEIKGIHGCVAALELKPGVLYRKAPQNRKDGDDEWRRVMIVTDKRQEPEVSLCALAALLPTNIHSEEQYAETSYNALYMIDYCIDHNHYALPHMKLTAQARRNAGVGLMDIAHYMAQRKLSYSSEEGMLELHRIAERHAYHLINASIRLGQERGNAEWIHKTDWPRGWTPQSTYNRNVDKLAPFVNQYDWDDVSKRLIDCGGGRFSSLIAHMPGESSSKYSAATNSLMDLRELSIIKTDGDNSMYWVAPEADTLKEWYSIAWNRTRRQHSETYAIFQKWADQSISADWYATLKGDEKVSSSDLIEETNYAADLGQKTVYYTNSDTADKEALKAVSVRVRREVAEDDGLDTSGPVCTSGGCSV
ncbi:Ribonucleoside-diphosphate reductase 1 subunit alpha [compost metagenome]